MPTLYDDSDNSVVTVDWQQQIVCKFQNGVWSQQMNLKDKNFVWLWGNSEPPIEQSNNNLYIRLNFNH